MSTFTVAATLMHPVRSVVLHLLVDTGATYMLLPHLGAFALGRLAADPVHQRLFPELTLHCGA